MGSRGRDGFDFISIYSLSLLASTNDGKTEWHKQTHAQMRTHKAYCVNIKTDVFTYTVDRPVSGVVPIVYFRANAIVTTHTHTNQHAQK